MTASWEELLDSSRPCDHLVQLYEHDGFLTRAVVRFLATGLVQEEGAVTIATPDHVRRFAVGLGRAGLDVRDLVDRNQLAILDAEESLARFMVGGMPDRAAFVTLVREVLERVRDAGFSKVRLFGEMVELLRHRSFEAALRLEALWNEVLADERVSLLCAYRLDNFSREAHRNVLHDISRSHSHLIPVEDYPRLGQAVDRAYADVFGTSGDGAALRAVLASRGAGTTHMPPAEGALLALRELSPTLADQVLERARLHYAVALPPSAPAANPVAPAQ